MPAKGEVGSRREPDKTSRVCTHAWSSFNVFNLGTEEEHYILEVSSSLKWNHIKLAHSFTYKMVVTVLHKTATHNLGPPPFKYYGFPDFLQESSE
jgi:hypothetical protein